MANISYSELKAELEALADENLLLPILGSGFTLQEGDTAAFSWYP